MQQCLVLVAVLQIVLSPDEMAIDQAVRALALGQCDVEARWFIVGSGRPPVGEHSRFFTRQRRCSVRFFVEEIDGDCGEER